MVVEKEHLHETYFLRGMYFNIRNSLLKLAQDPLQDDSDSYLTMRQRGELQGLPELSGGKYSNNLESALGGYNSTNNPISYGITKNPMIYSGSSKPTNGLTAFSGIYSPLESTVTYSSTNKNSSNYL